jgi:hypothetical protein
MPQFVYNNRNQEPEENACNLFSWHLILYRVMFPIGMV